MMIGFQASAETATTTAVPAAAEIAVVAPSADTAVIASDAGATGGSSVESAIPATASIKQMKETEIPVNLEATKKAAENENPILKFVLSFAIIGVLGCAAYFFIRKYRFQNPRAQATQIKVLTQHYLGPKKSLAIVRVAGESVLIGITDHNITMIKSLSLLDEDIPEEAPKEFQSVFAKKNASARFAEDPENKDEFSISGIKDIVSGKLKNMRSLE
jgi:flagellar protein FliO/FliZ